MSSTKRETPKYMTLSQLARASGLPEITIRRYARAGKIHFFQPGGAGSRLLFLPDALERGGTSPIAWTSNSAPAIYESNNPTGLGAANDVIERDDARATPDARRTPRARWRRQLGKTGTP